MACDFCPPHDRAKTQMDLQLFENLAPQLAKLTRRVALHLRGDPLYVTNLNEYLNIALKHNLKIELTTNAHKLTPQHFELLTKKPIVQINFSLQSIFANPKLRNTNVELNKIVDFCKFSLLKPQRPFINLRLWALNSDISTIYQAFDVPIDSEFLAPKIKITKAPKFTWPSLKSGNVKNSYCAALKDQFGILSNATVVPCCLDYNGDIALGNATTDKLAEILNSQKADDIRAGFLKNTPIDELCKRCDFRLRFDTTDNLISDL